MKFALLALFLSLVNLLADPIPGVVDTLIFGDALSESAHHFSGASTETTTGGLGEPARRSLPKTPLDYYGGDLSFDLAVDPVKQNYFTVKFWGSDVNGGQKALLYLDGEQLGYRHLGDYEALNHGAGEPAFRDRFFYATAVLPLSATRGRSSIPITIRTIGSIAGYQLGGGYDGYQKKMTAPSRGYYRAYSHITAALAGLENEKQGTAPIPEIRPASAAEKRPARNQKSPEERFQERLAASGAMNPNDLAEFAGLAERLWPTLDASTREKTLVQLVAKIDGQSANAYDPNFFAKGIYQGDWGGSFAPVAVAILSMNSFVSPAQWQTWLDEKITVKEQSQTRREAWTRMIQGNFDYARTHLARITNQAMFCLHGAYRSNRALQIINPAAAEPEATASRFLLAAAGLAPFRGNDILDATGKLIGHEDPFGTHYLQITEKGLTREFTYVAIYGEIANDLVHYWELYGGDEIFKKALLSANARAQMKYSDFDEKGYRGMRMEGVIESRGPAYPDDVGYVQRGRSLGLVRLAREMAEHPEKYAGAEWESYRKIARNIIGYAQQMIADNQLSDGQGKEYDFIKAQPPTGVLLPHTNLAWYSPAEIEKLKAAGLNVADLQRHAWADEDNGTISLREGDLTMFVGLVMKANWGINGIARVHCITPAIDRLATVAPDVQYDWSGEWSVRPDWTNVQFMNANNPPEGPLQALAGEILPFASQPTVKPTAKVDNPYVGYGNFYSLRYLKYLIGMNTTRAVYGNARSYSLKLPAGFKASRVFDFISKTELAVKDGAVAVGPQSTVILEMPDNADPAPLPLTPRLVVAFSDVGDSTTVRWQHAGGATGYIVRRAASPEGPWQEIGRTTGENSFTAGTPKIENAFYKVAGLSENGVGPDSPAATGRPPNAEITAWLGRKPADPAAGPEAVRDFRGENIRQRVNLSWKVARRGTSYEVLRAAQPDGPFTPVAKDLTSTTWSEENLPFNQKVFYAIVALGRDGKRGPQSPAIEFSPFDDTTPAPWQGTDIGNVGAEGIDGLRDGIFSIRGAGSDVWDSQDSLRLVHQPLAGDATLVAHLADQQNTDEWAKCGLMIRESVDPGSKNIFLFSTRGHGLLLQNRAQTSGKTVQSVARTDLPLTPWLKLTRKGNLLTGFASRDGQSWQEIGSATVDLPEKILVGMAVTSHVRGALNLTKFSDVKVTTETAK